LIKLLVRARRFIATLTQIEGCGLRCLVRQKTRPRRHHVAAAMAVLVRKVETHRGESASIDVGS
jgi:hypothetical protein